MGFFLNLLSLLGCASAALGASAYVVETIQMPSGFTDTSLAGINNSGQVAGYGKNGAIASQVFIASPVGSFVVPLPPGGPLRRPLP